jgi:hypothetical protein
LLVTFDENKAFVCASPKEKKTSSDQTNNCCRSDKKERKNSSYIRKSRREWLQSHI